VQGVIESNYLNGIPDKSVKDVTLKRRLSNMKDSEKVMRSWMNERNVKMEDLAYFMGIKRENLYALLQNPYYLQVRELILIAARLRLPVAHVIDWAFRDRRFMRRNMSDQPAWWEIGEDEIEVFKVKRVGGKK
jgi:hypothetical protein